MNGLTCLDLQDLGTQLRLQPALQQLIQFVYTFECSSGSSVAGWKAGPQWARLSRLLLCFRGQGQVDLATNSMEVPFADRRTGEYGHKSTTGGIYEPSSKVVALHFVRKADRVYHLHCNGCGKALLSQWVFVHRNVLKILRPREGHYRCGKFESDDGLPCMNDHISHLRVCVHDQTQKDCRLCGGPAICKHSRRRRQCNICRGAGLLSTYAGEGAPEQ